MEGSIPEEAVTLLEETFAEKFPGNTLTVEIQPWDGIVSKQQTSLASASESPDLVETGNTQSTTFTSVGAFADVSDLYEELGGEKLIPSFVEAGMVDGKNYAFPLYAGARGVFYRKDLLAAADLSEPTTIDEFREVMVALGAANPEGTDGFSGMYFAAVDIHGVDSFMFAAGGDFATDEGDGTFTAALTTPETLAALEQVQGLFSEATTYGLDSQASQKAFEKYFNEGKVGAMIGTGNVGTKIDQAMWDEDKVGVMALPSDTPGQAGRTFAGGSNISLAQNAQNPELAREALKIIFGEEFQTLIAEAGWAPGSSAYADAVTGPFGEISEEIIANSKLTPNTPQWGVAMSNNLVRDLFTELAQGGDVDAIAEKYNASLQEILSADA
jgi:N,N'-diacetylchitobiose transport system substrate-binding protein